MISHTVEREMHKKHIISLQDYLKITDRCVRAEQDLQYNLIYQCVEIDSKHQDSVKNFTMVFVVGSQYANKHSFVP